MLSRKGRFIKEQSRISYKINRSKYLRHGGFSATPGLRFPSEW